MDTSKIKAYIKNMKTGAWKQHTVTPESAGELLSMNAGENPVRDELVKKLMNIMKKHKSEATTALADKWEQICDSIADGKLDIACRLFKAMTQDERKMFLKQLVDNLVIENGGPKPEHLVLMVCITALY